MLKVTIKYPIVQQLLISNANHSFYIALADKKAARLNTSAMQFAGQFANKFQSFFLDKGEYKELIPFFATAPYETRQISINFKANKNIAYKSIDLEFLYFVQKTERGYSLIVPVLNLTAFAAEESEIAESVTEVIRMDFIRNTRLDFLQNALSTLWFHDMELHEEEITLNTYTLSELERLQTDKQQKILPTVAQVLEFGQREKDKMLFGYETYLKQVGDVLKSQYNRSILLVGKTGVGKTTLVWEAVRQRKALGISQTVWETTASTLIKELTQQTGWQQGLTVLCQELRSQGDVLFVRNLVELFEVGQYEGNSVSMGLFMREFIARGEVTLISECSDEELAHLEMRQPNFSNLFNIIHIEEPADNLQQIIQQKIQTIAENKNVEIALAAIQETVRLQRRYMPYAGFPGKPIRFLESILINTRHLSQIGLALAHLDKEAVIRAFCDETGMPEFMINPEVQMHLASVEDFFLRNVFGQNHAVHILLDMLAAVKTSLLRQGKPIASMLFVGATGVGKTEMAKVLAEFMFGSRDKMIRFDMSEFSDHTAVGRLIGEHYFADGLLTSAVRREPFCVLLFDELEKASPDFNDLLLQMLGEGRLSDSQGKIVNFCSTIIIMTSNIGAKKLQTNNIGWDSTISDAEIAVFFENEVRKFFRPEIFNRIDQIIPFYALNINTIKKVVAREIDMLTQREGIFGRKLDWKCSDDVFDYLAQIGHHPKYGARALQRALREELIIPLAQMLNQYPFDEKIVLHISMQNNILSIDVDTDPFKIDLMLEELTHHEFTDYASDLRQRIYRLLDGNAYGHFLSELKDLENKQKKQAKDFWNNAREPRKLSYFVSIKERINKAVEIIDDMETDMAMISMNLRPLNTLLYDKIKAWEQDYASIKLELLGLLYPEYNITFMGIYGKNPQPFLQFYIDLCESKNFSWEAKTVWFRESLYNEEFNPDEDSNNEFDFDLGELNLDLDLETDSNYYVVDEQSKDEKPEKIKRKAYFKKAYNPEKTESHNFKADKKDDLLVGCEILIMAHGIKLYFENENGVHRLSTGSSDKNFISCLIQTMDINEKTQENLHRKFNQFNMTRPRRTVFDQSISDTVFKLNKVRALKNNDKDEQLALIQRYLDTAFMRRLEEVLSN